MRALKKVSRETGKGFKKAGAEVGRAADKASARFARGEIRLDKQVSESRSTAHERCDPLDARLETFRSQLGTDQSAWQGLIASGKAESNPEVNEHLKKLQDQLSELQTIRNKMRDQLGLILECPKTQDSVQSARELCASSVNTIKELSGQFEEKAKELESGLRISAKARANILDKAETKQANALTALVSKPDHADSSVTPPPRPKAPTPGAKHRPGS